MESSIAFAAALAALAVQSTPDRPTDELSAAGVFNVQRTANRCVATMVLRSGDEAIRVDLENRPSTDEFVFLIEAPGNFGGKVWAKARSSLGSRQLADKSIIFEPSLRSGAMIYRLHSNRPELEAAGSSTELDVRSRSFQITVPILGLDEAIAKLDECASSLMAQWGFSLESQAQLATYPRPKGNLSDYASPRDYPASALRTGAMGDVHALVEIDAKGRARGCRIVRSSGHQELDAMTCKILTERTRYLAGKSLAGGSVDAPAYLTFRWEIPQ